MAAEYGWTDDQILDLTMARLTQIRAVIWERRNEERRTALRDKETELRILAGYIAGSAGHKEGVAAAEKISLVPSDCPADGQRQIDPDRLPSTSMVTRMFSGSR